MTINAACCARRAALPKRDSARLAAFQMTPDRKTFLVLAVSAATFLGLAAVFVIDSARRPDAAPVQPARSIPRGTAPVRISAEMLIRTDGDTSILDCYACHDQAKQPQVPVNAAGRVVLPPDHADLIFGMRNCVACHAPAADYEIGYDAEGNTIIPPAHAADLIIAHGLNSRNSACFNCHNPAQLDQLVTRDGTALKLEQATLLCASCHGPTYRDWEAGIHGRTTGFWRLDLGETTRESCTSCHDPHAPAFPLLIPLPGPQTPKPRT